MALLEFPEFSVGSTVHQHSQIDALVNYYSTFNLSAKGGHTETQVHGSSKWYWQHVWLGHRACILTNHRSIFKLQEVVSNATTLWRGSCWRTHDQTILWREWALDWNFDKTGTPQNRAVAALPLLLVSCVIRREASSPTTRKKMTPKTFCARQINNQATSCIPINTTPLTKALYIHAPWERFVMQLHVFRFAMSFSWIKCRRRALRLPAVKSWRWPTCKSMPTWPKTWRKCKN